MDIIDNLKNQIDQASFYSRSKSDDHGEVFTPFELITEMVKKIPLTTLTDPSKTYFDPCAGKGNFPIILVKVLMKTLAKAIPDEADRLKHIVENQLFMAEYQKESADFIAEHFTFGIVGLRPNLFHGDTLEMPIDWFDKPWEEREEIRKNNPNGFEPKKPTDLFDLFS